MHIEVEKDRNVMVKVKVLPFSGRDFHHCLDDNTLRFHIREPFYSAGKQFGWNGATIGLGINLSALIYAIRNNLTIRVTIAQNKNAYLVDPRDWKVFADEHKSMMEINEVLILIVQWTKKRFRSVPKDQLDGEIALAE